jgi:PAS domain S-box-containing protein
MNLSFGFKKAAKLGSGVLIIGLVISAGLTWWINETNVLAIKKALQSTSEHISRNVLERITLYQYGLRGARGMITTAGEHHVSREGFIRYSLTREVDKEFPGARGFGFIRRVLPEQEAEFIEKAQQDGWPVFGIRQLAPHDDERYVIQYIEPVERNYSAVGLDIGSEKQRRDAADAAMLSGEVTLSGPITLVQATGKPLQSFLILMPIYRNGTTPTTTEAREAEAFGWSYAPLVTNEVLIGLDLYQKTTKLQLSDITQLNNPIPFYETDAEDTHIHSPYQYTINKEVFGRKWQFKITAYPEFIHELHLNRPSLIFSYTAVFSLLLAALAFLWSLAIQRKQQMLAEQARRANMLEHSLDGIISYDLEGRVTSWNKGAELLFGYSESEAMGSDSATLIVPKEKVHHEKAAFRKVLIGETVLNQVSKHQCKDGKLVSTSMTALPIIDGQGDIVGISQTLRDITAQQDAELRIIKSNESLELKVAERTTELLQAVSENKALLKSINNQLVSTVTDTDGIILEVNDYFCRMSGYSREELIGKNHSILKSGEHDDVFWQTMWAQIKSGESWHGEICNCDKQGNIHWFDTVIGPVMDENGNIERFIALSTDITERKFTQIEKAQLSSLLSSVLDAASEVSIIATDENGLITIFNRGAELLLGYEASELVGITSPACLHLLEEVQARSITLSAEYGFSIEGFDTFVYKARTEGPETRNWTYVRKDGSQCQVSLSVTAMRDSAGNILGYLGIGVDITQTLLQQEALLTASNHLSKASDVAKLGIWTFNIKDNSLEWNDRMFAIYDQPLTLRDEGLEYQHWLAKVHPDDTEMAERKLQDAIAGHGTYDLVFRVFKPDGGIRYVQAAAQIERDKHGNAVRVIGINLDVTEQREIEVTLREAKQQADEANAAKSAFLANMSHEIRTPMNAVLGMLQLMLHTTMSAQQQDYITKTQTAAKSLLGLLNDILDFSKIEAGKLLLDPQPCEIEMLMRDLAVVLSGNLGNRDVEVIFNLDPNIPSWLLIDKLRLQQVLINLAGNALKFTHSGQVIVGIECLEATEHNRTLRFSITDTGIGISEEQMGRIFTGFEQAESSTSRRFGGTGLGLAISKRLVELMGGDLLVTSELGQGSCFWFDLVLPALPTPTEVSIDIQGKRILVVDDNHTTTDILAKILLDFGCEVQCVYSGVEAIAQYEQASSMQTPFDIVLMDWNMPVLNGVETAQQLQQLALAQQTATPAVIMLTAYSEEVLSSPSSEALSPFVHFLTKPVTSQLLAESINLVLTGKVASSPVQMLSQKRLQGLTILVVEDNQLNRQVVDELLTLEGAKVVLAKGGTEGVAFVTQSQQTFDMVIMDVQMPDMDGLEATRLIRSDNRFELLPILAMTANASQSDRLDCIAAGMNDHIGKPIDMPKLIPSILTLVGREFNHSVYDNSVVELGSSVVETPAENESLFDSLEQTLSRFGGNEAFFNKMAHEFEIELNKQLQQLHDAVAKENKAQVAAISHGLKGFSSNFGAKALANFAAYIEAQCKQGEPNAQQLNEWTDRLCDLAQESVQHLNDYLAESSPNETNVVLQTNANSSIGAGEHDTIMLLKQMLQQSNLEAMTIIEDTACVLSHHPRWPELYSHVQALEFDKALEVLTMIETEVS